MANITTTLSEMYEVLLQLRYPEITKAESKDIGSTILTGEYRISLLTWLLEQECESVGNILKKLTGVALEDELFKHYSYIGICNNKDLLLGKCSLNEQHSTLVLLLKFMKNVHLKSGSSFIIETQIDNILEAYVTKDSSIIPLIGNVNTKMTHSEAIFYFKSVEETLQKNETESIQQTVIVPVTVPKQEEPTECTKPVDPEVFLETQKEFVEAFGSLSTQQTATKTVKATTSCMDADVESIYTNFSTLNQILQAKDKIAKFHIPKDFQSVDSPLNEVIENIVTCMEEVKHVRVSDS